VALSKRAKLPIGLRMIAIFDFSQGALIFMLSVALLLLGFPLGSYVQSTLYSAVLLILGLGLWRRRPWARWGSIALALVGLIGGFGLVVFMPSLYASAAWWELGLVILGACVNSLILITLLTPGARRWFLSCGTQGDLESRVPG
jgi:hypothetical protein